MRMQLSGAPFAGMRQANRVQGPHFGSRAAVDRFKQSLGETVAWGSLKASRADMQGSLRTPALNPQIVDRFASHGSQDLKNGMDRIEKTRKQLLNGMGLQPVPVNKLNDGKLMVFFPNMTLSDGAAEVESNGFLDADNTPAWDSWVFVGEEKSPPGWPGQTMPYVVAWVPQDFVGPVGKGIAVNPEECIQWLDDHTAFPSLNQLKGAVQ